MYIPSFFLCFVFYFRYIVLLKMDYLLFFYPPPPLGKITRPWKCKFNGNNLRLNWLCLVYLLFKPRFKSHSGLREFLCILSRVDTFWNNDMHWKLKDCEFFVTKMQPLQVLWDWVAFHKMLKLCEKLVF